MGHFLECEGLLYFYFFFVLEVCEFVHLKNMAASAFLNDRVCACLVVICGERTDKL